MPRPGSLTLAAIIAMAFGMLTILAGTRALIAPGEGVVPFVLHFNVAAGFAYVLAGIGLWRRAGWAPGLSALIALATMAVLAAFLFHVAQGGPWMGRTLGALILRSGVWAAIAVIAFRRS